MKILAILELSLFLFLSHAAHAGPSATDESSRDARVKSLEAQLTAARQEVARLETELTVAREQTHTPQANSHEAAARMSPAASSRLQDNELRDGDVRNVTRIAQQVPGMLFGQTGNEVRFAIRGAYTNRTGPESEPVVGIFEDGVPFTTTTQALGPYVDAREVVVLRGPQGVDHGRYGFGGVIEVRSNEPDPSGWDSALEGTIAYSDLTRFQAMLNIPVLDTLAIRLAGAGESYSGYVNNYVLEETDSDDLKTRAQQFVRLAVKWQPTEDFNMRLNFASLDQNGSGSGLWGYQQVGAMIDDEYFHGHHFAPAGGTPDYGPWDIARNMISLAELENLSTTLAFDWNLGFATLKWLGNKSKFESLQAFDSDYSNGGSPYDSVLNGWNSFMDTLTTDLVLSSTNPGALDWTVGLHYLQRDTDWGWLETRANVLYRPQWDLGGNYSTDSIAAYTSAGFRLTESLRLLAGLRWYEDEKQSRSGEVARWDGTLWNAGAEYALNDTTNGYLKVSTAYRPGGLNEASGIASSYDAEKVTAYEAGLGSSFASDTIRLNLAAFLHDYEDLQAQSFTQLTLPGGPAVTDYLVTAGGKETLGLELEVHWTPGADWDIAAYLAWLDAKFKAYTVPALAGLDVPPGHDASNGLRLDGARPAYSPDWMAGLHLGYNFGLGNWGGLRPVIQARYVADYYTNDLNLPGAMQRAHTMADLRLFWRLPGDRVSVQAYIENLGDEAVLQATTIYNPAERPDIATILAGWGDPRKYGLIVSWRY